VRKLLLLALAAQLAAEAQVAIDTVVRPGFRLYSCASYLPDLDKLYVTAPYRVVAFDCSTWQVCAEFATDAPPGSCTAYYAWNPLRRKLYVSFNTSLVDSMLVICPDADTAKWIPFDFKDIQYVGSEDLMYGTPWRSPGGGPGTDLCALDCSADTVVKVIHCPVPGYELRCVSWDSVRDRVYSGVFALNNPGYLAVFDVAADSLLELLALDCLSPLKLNFHYRLHKAYFISEAGFGAPGRAGVVDLDSLSLVRLFPPEASGYYFNHGPVAVNTLLDKAYFGGNTGRGPLPTTCTLLVVDCATDSVIKNIEYRGRGSHRYVAWVPWSNRLYFTADEASHMTVIDCRNDSVIVPELILPGQMLSALNVLLDPIRERIFALGADTAAIYVLRDVPPGVTETPEPEWREPYPGPTIVRDVLVWSATTPSLRNAGDIALQSGASLLDIAGRKVMELAPGPNDVRHLSPGVYFIQRNAVSGERQAVAKVLIAR
jgi:hypothetical protein